VTRESGGVLEAVPEDSDGRDTIIERIVATTMLGAGGDVRRRRQRGRYRRLGSGPHRSPVRRSTSPPARPWTLRTAEPAILLSRECEHAPGMGGGSCLDE
jgi:hypothetical protein